MHAGRATFRDLGARAVLDAIVARLGLPLIVKPDQGGSALGTRLVGDAADLPSAMVDCLAYGSAVLVARYRVGTEVSVCVCADPDPRALPAVEIQPAAGVYDYTARYTPGATAFHCPARLSPEVLSAAEQAALDAHRVLGLRDLSRTDAIVGTDGVVHVLEVDVCPGLTGTSLLPTAVDAAGEHLGQLFGGLIDEAVRRG